MNEPDADFVNNKESAQISLDEESKISVLFKAVGDAPCMKKSKWKIKRSYTLSETVGFLRKYLKFDPNKDNLFIFVSSSFAPPLDTELGALYDCFNAEGTLILQYCKSLAWG